MVEACVEPTMKKKSPSDVTRDPRVAHSMWGEFIIKIYRFNTIVRVREPSYEDNCLSQLHADFSFIENDVFN